MKRQIIEVNQDGDIIIPKHLREKFGLVPGSKFIIEEDEHRLNLSKSTHALHRVYVEVTNQCNLNCKTCIRHIWDIEPGYMSDDTFQKIIIDTRRLDVIPEIFFGGYGEPLSHPNIIGMINKAKSIGARTSLITNGTLLSDEMSMLLIDSGLDMLWISIDGAYPESYQDVRLGNHLPEIINNIKRFHLAAVKIFGESPWARKPQMGFAFVLMRSNESELQQVIELGSKLGVTNFYITNALAYSENMSKEVLYENCIYHRSGNWAGTKPRIWFPRMGFEKNTQQAFGNLVQEGYQIKLSGNLINRNPSTCPFVAKGATVIRWDGELSPCLPLMYKHKSIFEDWERQVLPYSVGNINENEFKSLWLNKEYLALRERVMDMNFSPCVDCHTCEMSEDNLMDCMGFEHPNCGGCLWAHGVIQCP